MLVELDIDKINDKVAKRCKELAKRFDDFDEELGKEALGIHSSPQKGFYYGDFNLHHLFESDEHFCEFELKNDNEYIFEQIGEDIPFDARVKYGVADNVEQILEHFPELITSDRLYMVNLTIVTKEDCPSWRWHKWGTYYGTQKPTMEHLGDEEIIEQVIVFHIHELSQRT